jgi:membrane protease YdiL (CAAX protease family)
VLWLLVLGSAVPSLAAFVVAGSLGRSELVALLGRLRPIGKGCSVSRALLAYAAIVPLLATCLLATYGIRQLLDGPGAWIHPPGVLGWSLLPALLTATFLDQGGVLEELGWRGYAQPELQRSLTSPLAAAVLIGVAWGLWHVPRDVVAGVVDRLGLVAYLVHFLPAFVAGTVAVSVIAAFFTNRCGGSVLPAIMVHGVSNDAIGLSGHAAMETILTPVHQATQALPLAALAAILIALSGPELGRRRGGGA